MTTLVLFGEVSVASLLGNGIVLGALLGGALRGWRTGLLTTTLLGFAVTVSFIVAFATAKLVSSLRKEADSRRNTEFCIKIF